MQDFQNSNSSPHSRSLSARKLSSSSDESRSRPCGAEGTSAMHEKMPLSNDNPSTKTERDARSSRWIAALILVNVILIAGYFYSRNAAEDWEQRLQREGRSLSPSAEGASSLLSFDPLARFTTKSSVPRKPRKGEKFLAYLPHSGFHNQRIELENALLLAYYLKRTLVIPPCFHGPPMPWLRYDKLYSRLTLQTKHGLEHCPYLPPMIEDPLCVNYTKWTQTSWEYVFDFDRVRPYVNIIHRDDIKEIWLKEHLEIDDASNIAFFKDRTFYEYRISDSEEEDVTSPLLIKYNMRLDVEQLTQIPEKLLQFGSLFGSGRVGALTLEHSTFFRLVKSSLIYTNPRLLKAADHLVSKLGGLGKYVGVHLRVGDGVFRSKKQRNVNTAIAKLNKLLLREAKMFREASEAPTIASPSAKLEGMEIHARFAPSGARLSREKCLARSSEADVSPILFLATDARDPDRDPAFSQLFDRWPCIFTLSDFWNDFDEIKNEVNDFDMTNLSKYLIPMLDSVVAAKGRLFVGTAGSTFSAFVSRLHDEYTSGIVPSSASQLDDEESDNGTADPFKILQPAVIPSGLD